jgi:uncharacterized protein (UPF0332 family)
MKQKKFEELRKNYRKDIKNFLDSSKTVVSQSEYNDACNYIDNLIIYLDCLFNYLLSGKFLEFSNIHDVEMIKRCREELDTATWLFQTNKYLEAKERFSSLLVELS